MIFVGNVIPVQTGSYVDDVAMDSGLRRSDGTFFRHAVAERHPLEMSSAIYVDYPHKAGNDGVGVFGNKEERQK